MSKNTKIMWTVLNYIKHLLSLVSTVSDCISVSGFASLVGMAIGILSSAVDVNIWAKLQ